jgi:voltage-gated potassium channel
LREAGNAGNVGRMNPELDSRYGERLMRVDRLTELPMLVLAFAYVPVFVVGYLRDVPDDVSDAARVVSLCIIASFAVELAVKVAVARGRPLAYLRTHWLDVLIVFVPFLRPLRILRVLRVLPFIARGAVGVQKILGEYKVAYVLFVGLLSVLMSAFLVLVFERGAGGTIQTFAGALWWAAQTVTTVGYGDVVPITTGGRVVAVILMVIGITLFGVLTAGVAAYFVHDPTHNAQDEQTAKILARFDSLERRLGSLESRLDEHDHRREGDDQR